MGIRPSHPPLAPLPPPLHNCAHLACPPSTRLLGFKLASRCNSRRPKSRPAAVDPSSSAQDGAGNGQQRRADDMLKGELLSTLMQRRAMLADQQLPPLGWQQQAGTSQLASGDKGPLYAAAALQEQPPQQIGQLNGQPAPDASLPSPAAGGVPVADAAAAAPRKRGRPRKKAPSAASGSSLVSSSEGGGLAGSYGAAVALAAYEAALARSALATVAFCLDAKLEYGQRVRVVGGHEELGALVCCAVLAFRCSFALVGGCGAQGIG